MKKPNSFTSKFTQALPASRSELNSQLVSADRRFSIAAGMLDNEPDGQDKSAETDRADGLFDKSKLNDELSEQYRNWCVQHRYLPGQTLLAPVSSLKTTAFNPRHFYNENKITELSQSILENGQQQAIHVVPDYENPGTYFVADGGSRTRALQKARIRDALITVVDLEIGIQSYKLGYELNSQRASQTPFDNAVVWSRMLEGKQFLTQANLAEALRIDAEKVSQTLALRRLPDGLLQEMVVAPERFGTRMAYEIVRFYEKTSKDDDATLKLIRRVVDGELRVRDVQAIVNHARESRVDGKKARQSAVQRFRFKDHAGQSLGELKTYGENRIDLKLVNLPEEIRDRLERAIREVLQPFSGKPGTATE
ncbi:MULTISPECIES: ParB/RepB/Spo0J family partition protein [unclassified Paraburkholderia]|uniref:ParB/RepB/Spo0J family partition protein n=1 Tax=unclassified Paraburkholderia TaxID=2615204 RepID=UPI002AB13115|nr:MULTISPECIES: ParB/RepB/Spo0J family partition protein [unclassified Paraburkholderia]